MSSKQDARRVRTVKVDPGGAYSVLERIILDQGGRFLTPDDVREALLFVAPLDDAEAVEVHGLRAQSVLFYSPQLDGDWDIDDVGYTFRHRIPPDMIEDRGRAYRVEYEFRVLGDTGDVSSYTIRREYTITAGSGLWA